MLYTHHQMEINGCARFDLYASCTPTGDFEKSAIVKQCIINYGLICDVPDNMLCDSAVTTPGCSTAFRAIGSEVATDIHNYIASDLTTFICEYK